MLVTDKQFYMETKLREKLDLMCERCTKRKFDNLLLIDGSEGYGKSTCGVGVAYYIAQQTGRSFNLNNLFFSVDELIDFAIHSKDQIIFWDEAALAGLAMESYRRIQVKLLKLLMVARKKRHFYLFLIPKFFRLREPIVDRAIGLIHVYARNELQLGRFCYYKKKNLDRLYHEWRTARKYSYKKYLNFWGSFPDILGKIIDEPAYDKMKDKAILSIDSDDGSSQLNRLKVIIKDLKALIATVPGIKQKDLAQHMQVTAHTLRNWAKTLDKGKGEEKAL